MKHVIKTKRRLQTRLRLALTAACALTAGLLASSAVAQEGTPRELPGESPTGTTGTPFEEALRITVGASVAYDNNFFRDPGILRNPQSETITTGYVGLHIDKPYSQQRFFLGATATTYRYETNSYLDFTGFDYRAAWYWHLTPRINGTLSASRVETPTQFQYTFSRQSDVMIADNYVFDLNGQLFGGWYVLLGISQLNLTSQQGSLQGQPDYRETRSHAGIRYLFQTGTSIDALWRHIDGNQDSQVINNVIVASSSNYRENQSELRGTWSISLKSNLSARVTYLDRNYDQTPASDFSGTAGELGFNWLPTEKLSLRLAAVRNIEAWQSLTSNYRVSNTFSFTPSWRPTAKTNFYLNLRRTYDDYPATSTAVPERKDTTDSAGVGFNWLALRHLSIGVSVQYEERSSNNPLVEYNDTIGRINASLTF